MTLTRTLTGAAAALALAASVLAVTPTAASASAPCLLPEDAIGAARYVRSSAATFHTARTYLYGDSITVQSWAGLLDLGLAVDGRWGRTVTTAVDLLVADADLRSPAVVVLAAGTNDLNYPYQVRRQVQRARIVLPPTTRLVWVDVYRSGYPAESAYLNDYVAGLAGVEYVAWSSIAATPGYLIDGTHLTCPKGADMRNGLIRRQVNYPGGYPG
jgi:hypothetical protein